MIEIYGPKIYIAGLESLENTNLIILDETYYQKEILRKNILLKDITLTKILPNKLKMVLKMRDPYIRLMILNNNYILSEDGVVLKIGSNPKDVPIISVEKEIIIYKIGDRVDSFIINAIELARNLKERNIDFDKIVLNKDSGTITFNTPSSILVVLSLNKNNDFVAPSLQIITSRFRIEGKEPIKIDFRFDKPIITLKNP